MRPYDAKFKVKANPRAAAPIVLAYVATRYPSPFCVMSLRNKFDGSKFMVERVEKPPKNPIVSARYIMSLICVWIASNIPARVQETRLMHRVGNGKRLGKRGLRNEVALFLHSAPKAPPTPTARKAVRLIACRPCSMLRFSPYASRFVFFVCAVGGAMPGSLMRSFHTATQRM